MTQIDKCGIPLTWNKYVIYNEINKFFTKMKYIRYVLYNLK